MNDAHHIEKPMFLFKIVQSGENIEIPLIEKNLKREFKDFYYKLLKELKLKQRNVYISNEQGKMMSNSDLELTLEDVISKFGIKLKVYSEKIF